METALITIPAFLFTLGVIIFVHELGHFLAAQLFGVRVLTFSLGFGRRLGGFIFRGTDCRISLIPLGGYVRMGGELADERTGDPSEFLSKPRWQRIIVYLAGPLMNVVLAVVLIAGLFMYGIPIQAMQDLPSVVGVVEEGSAAAAAGLAPGDRIVEVNGKEVDLWKEVAFALVTSPERPVSLEVRREDVQRTVVVTPFRVPRDEYGDAGVYPQALLRISEVIRDTPADRAGFRSGDELRHIDSQPILRIEDFIAHIEARPGIEIEIEVMRRGELMIIPVVPDAIDGKGKIGVRPGSYRKLPLPEAVVESVRYNLDIVYKSTQLLGKLFTNEIAPKSALSGPIEIAAWSGRAARRGWKDLIYLMGFLSISIGFMNLLPIPVLDGGHIAILLTESAIRRDLSLVVKERITQLGFMMLMTLMAVVIFFDLAKNLPSLMPGS